MSSINDVQRAIQTTGFHLKKEVIMSRNAMRTLSMPKRIRLSHYKGLPPNLYFYENRYKYRHPVTGKFSGMGMEKLKAVEAAQQLNALLMGGHDLVARVLGKEGNRFADFLKAFMQEI